MHLLCIRKIHGSSAHIAGAQETGTAPSRCRRFGEARQGVVLVRCATLPPPPPPVFRKPTPILHPKPLKDSGTRLTAPTPASPAADIEKNARALLSGFFAKMDLVTREEFDIQAQVLLRTREKLKALEDRVTRLENPPSGD